MSDSKDDIKRLEKLMQDDDLKQLNVLSCEYDVEKLRSAMSQAATNNPDALKHFLGEPSDISQAELQNNMNSYYNKKFVECKSR